VSSLKVSKSQQILRSLESAQNPFCPPRGQWTLGVKIKLSISAITMIQSNHGVCLFFIFYCNLTPKGF